MNDLYHTKAFYNHTYILVQIRLCAFILAVIFTPCMKSKQRKYLNVIVKLERIRNETILLFLIYLSTLQSKDANTIFFLSLSDILRPLGEERP